MPATRGINLRSGDLAEQLGLFLLQTVSLTAPVPRTEDVGIDVISTLIRKFDQYSYIAANSFFVSIKSSSIENVTYEGHEVQWLANLELPFFIASVDRKEGSIELFCAHHLYNAFATNSKRESITLHLTAPPQDQDFVPADDNNIHIGPSIMKWTLDTLNKEPDFQTKFFDIVKSHIDVAMNSIQTYSIGFIENFAWETNKPLKKGLYKTICADEDPIKGFNDVDNKMAPYFAMWLDKILRSKNIGRLDETISLLQRNKELMELINKRE
ncbi:hypothetical protein [Peribacillus frigoritolerans]|uniref:hypothetical protein n=1 Tax=Peribacillus frigoritolerans TaxID=450367 RepID=UPI0025A2EB0D|nr:hypothetical protein [Peribacillus frigoritolerans]MDM5304295.1 hypothetical protein [Peribacillus frigoritolerans]